MSTPLSNPTADAFRAHGQFNGLAPLDESVANTREHELTIGRLSGQVERLREALAHKDADMAALRDALSERDELIEALKAELRAERLMVGA